MGQVGKRFIHERRAHVREKSVMLFLGETERTIPRSRPAFRIAGSAGRVKGAKRDRSRAQRSEHGCAWHGHWIGGESPSRGALVATASRRQLHAERAVVRRHSWRREAVWGRSPRRTAAPNDSEALDRPGRPGERARGRDAQNPTEVGAVVGTEAAGHPVHLTQGGLHGSARAVDPKEATTTGRRPCRSRISWY
jgi:hypothetical protein